MISFRIIKHNGEKKKPTNVGILQEKKHFILSILFRQTVVVIIEFKASQGNLLRPQPCTGSSECTGHIVNECALPLYFRWRPFRKENYGMKGAELKETGRNGWVLFYFFIYKTTCVQVDKKRSVIKLFCDQFFDKVNSLTQFEGNWVGRWIRGILGSVRSKGVDKKKVLGVLLRVRKTDNVLCFY